MFHSVLIALSLQAAPMAPAPAAPPPAAPPAAIPAPLPGDAEIRERIEKLDAALFYAVFEGCTPQVVADTLLPDFRMVHDKGGLTADSGADFVAQIEQNCLDRAPGGKNAGYRNRRLAVPGTRTIRQMGEWGVVENGEHVFFELRERPAGAYGADDPGGPDWVLVGGASYTHLWQWNPQEGRFRLLESVSYDHGAALPYPPE